jgi:hypothetical protein
MPLKDSITLKDKSFKIVEKAIQKSFLSLLKSPSVHQNLIMVCILAKSLFLPTLIGKKFDGKKI